MNDLQDIKSLSINELEQALADFGEPKYRAKQIFQWIHKKYVNSFDEMLNLSKDLRQKLKENYYISCSAIEKKLISCYDSTVKYLFSLNDGEYVEAVLMSYHHGYSACISTQAGCKMGCTFCATGQGGFRRNLTAGEMLSQLQTMEKDRGVRISNVVLMGMGEPLDNFDNVVRFLRLVSSADGMNIGMRHLALSSCGLADKIRQLAELKLQITLSISLHAPNDEIRNRTMPVNKRFPIDELLSACREYIEKTGRRITFEYAMIDGVNDSLDCARQLASRLRGMLCHINLIPVNEVDKTGYKKSGKKSLNAFCAYLNNHGITATIRRTLGSDINASCGQLRGKAKETTD
ncbi:MAG: 23S rRNA (adenine(2503)-C(2))-methyltransferase RlmN [Acutalibacteraceae bacterium]